MTEREDLTEEEMIARNHEIQARAEKTTMNQFFQALGAASSTANQMANRAQSLDSLIEKLTELKNGLNLNE